MASHIARAGPAAAPEREGFLSEELLSGAVAGGVGGITRAREASQASLQDLAGQQLSLLRASAQPQQEQARKALEARLLSQGRLGGTSGALAEQAQQAGFGQADLAMQLQSRELAQQERQQQFGMGLDLAQFGVGTEGREIGFGFEERGIDLRQQEIQIQREEAEARRRAAAGPGFLGSVIGGLAPAVGAAMGGPLGGMLGTAISGAITPEGG